MVSGSDVSFFSFSYSLSPSRTKLWGRGVTNEKFRWWQKKEKKKKICKDENGKLAYHRVKTTFLF
jgi:hypothetical protein